MAKDLNIGNLITIRERLTDTINVCRKEANDAFSKREITTTQFQRARDEWGKLEIEESELQGVIMSLQIDFILTTDVDSPRSVITGFTDRLVDAARDIDNFSNFLTEIAKVIGVVTKIIGAISTGGILSLL